MECIATQQKCAIYSFGASMSPYLLWWGDWSYWAQASMVSHHLRLLLLEHAPGCEVWGYDFTVNSMHPLYTSANMSWADWGQMVVQFGPEIDKTPWLKERSHFFPWARGRCNAHGPEDSLKYYTLDVLMPGRGAFLSQSHQQNPAEITSACKRPQSSQATLAKRKLQAHITPYRLTSLRYRL